jgi:hypothetical protein
VRGVSKWVWGSYPKGDCYGISIGSVDVDSLNDSAHDFISKAFKAV